MANKRSQGFRAFLSWWMPFALGLALWHPSGCSPSSRHQKVQVEIPTTHEPKRCFAPPALPEGRRNAALQIFERVHPSLTIHYNGFSRQGSLICYDMLNELRTVDEARALMDVEFHLLDLMLEHYNVKQHMRIVDANVVKNMLDIHNLLSFRFPEVIGKVTRFIKEYDPILRVFLRRYLPHIELLVIVNVPTFLIPFLPTMASRIMGISASKIVAIANGSALERFMERKYIPKEFGNPLGMSVKDNDENYTASCLMLREIKTYLGDSGLTEEGKRMLEVHGPRLLTRSSGASSAAAGGMQLLAKSIQGHAEASSTSIGIELTKTNDETEPFDDID